MWCIGWDFRYLGSDQICHSRVVISDWFIAVKAVWSLTGLHIMFVTTYSPQGLDAKRHLWSEILYLITSFTGECIRMGDFNKVQDESEWFVLQFHLASTTVFNKFIEEA